MFRKILIKCVRSTLRWFGFDIVQFTIGTHPIPRQEALMKEYQIDTVIDVGANVGLYGRKLIKSLDYKGAIYSFEPMAREFGLLEIESQGFKNWSVFNEALGDKKQKSTINVSINSVSSSILGILDKHTESAPESKYSHIEEVSVNTIDNIVNENNLKSKNIFLKLDVQGFEKQALLGGVNSLKYIDTIQVEISLVDLYDGGILFDELFDILRAEGYTLVAIEPGFSHKKTGQMLQMDGIFHRYSKPL
jgi:FkbM family methyltransferase